MSAVGMPPSQGLTVAGQQQMDGGYGPSTNNGQPIDQRYYGGKSNPAGQEPYEYQH